MGSFGHTYRMQQYRFITGPPTHSVGEPD